MNKVEIVTQPSPPSDEKQDDKKLETQTLAKLQDLARQNPSPPSEEQEAKEQEKEELADDDYKQRKADEAQEKKSERKERKKQHKIEQKQNQPKCPNPTVQHDDKSVKPAKPQRKSKSSGTIHPNSTTDERLDDYGTPSPPVTDTETESEREDGVEYDEDGFEVPPGKIPIDGHFSTEEVKELVDIAKKEGFLKNEVGVKVLEHNDVVGDKIVLMEDDKKKVTETKKKESEEKKDDKSKDEKIKEEENQEAQGIEI